MENDLLKKKILQTIIQKTLNCNNQHTTTLSGSFLECIISQDKEKLKKLCENGLPEDLPILRSLVWKINLGYLPLDSEEWTKTFIEKRKLYDYYKAQFHNLLKNELKSFENKSQEEIQELEKTTNKVLLEEINKDVNRTHTTMSFFFQPLDDKKIYSQKEIKNIIENRRNCTNIDINSTYKINIEETHADVLSRILFIYCKFSPDVSYVQGMNEILAPIYYTFCYDKIYDIFDYKEIEADTFWTFYFLMDKIKKVFIREEDENDSGIKGKAKILSKLLKLMDFSIYNHLEKYNIEFSMFSYRWFILFFSQEFLMIDILRLWDYVFSEDNKFKKIYYLSLAILLIKKDDILVSDLSEILDMLQNLKKIDVEYLIHNSQKLEEIYGEKFNKIIN